MAFSLLPKYIFQRLTDLTPEFLTDVGIRLLMLDFDNTMLPYTTREPTAELLDWIRLMKDSGVILCVVSNGGEVRAPGFCREQDVDCITRSIKPFQRGIRKCLERYGIPASQAAMVGDQIFTDVLGGNCAGAASILITPLHLHNFWLKLRNWIEQPFIYLAKNRRMTHEKLKQIHRAAEERRG